MLYTPNASSDTGLHSALNPNSGNWYGLSYLCLQTSDDLIIAVRSAGPDRVFWTSDDVVSGE